MRFAAAIAAAGLAAGAAAAGNGTDVYVTEVVTAYTTFCPEATQITHAGQTYTVSEATTLTITNCPGGCTITKPVYSSTPVPVTSAPATSAPVTSAPVTTESTTPVAPVSYTTSMIPSASPIYSANGTTPATYAPSGTGSSATGSGSSVPFTGAAANFGAAAGAGLLAVFGLVAAL